MKPSSPRPKVVRLVTRLNIGGVARQALFLSRSLNAEFPTILAAGSPEPHEGELVDDEVPVLRVPLVRPVDPVADLRAFRTIRRLLLEHRPAIVHTHTAKAGAIGRLAALTVRPRPQLVHTFDGHVLEGNFDVVPERVFIAAERWLARSTDAIIAVSPEIRDSLLELGVGRWQQFKVISHGPELEPYLAVTGPSGRLRAHLGIGAGTPLVGIVGRLAAIKDVGTLLTAMEGLPGVHLAVIGDGEARSELEESSARSGLAGRVHFTGWSRDLPADVADLDVVAQCSRMEGTPLSLIEALAAAKPVVAASVGGVGYVVDDGVSGYLTPPGDPHQLSRRISELLADPGTRRRMGEAGRKAVLTRFDKRRLQGETAQLYRELIEDRP